MTWQRSKSVMGYLNKQGIKTLKEESIQDAIINAVRKYYTDNTFSKEELNKKLIILENESLYKKAFDLSAEYSLMVALIICIISCFVSIATAIDKVFAVEFLDTVKTYAIIPLVLIIVAICIVRIKDHYIYINKNSAINIHKSVIRERLKEIEEKKQQEIEKSKQEQNEKVILELKEIKKLLNCNIEDKDAMSKACNKIINDIF